METALAAVVAGLSAGEARPGQVEMARAVMGVLAATGRRHLAVAAGTGTGKSLGYLVPAILSGKHVVVATATLGLQDQLARKDLPLIAAGLGQKVSWAVLKGRSNYLCRQALEDMDRLGTQEALDLGGASRGRRAGRSLGGVGAEVAKLVSWADATETGDRADLDFEPSPTAWSAVSVSADSCPGAARCPSGGSCFAEAARGRAAEAQVVVVNHHLLGAHLRSDGAVLPEHDALVVDEAHELEDILATGLGADVGPGRVQHLVSAARAALTGAGEKTTGGVDDVIEAARRFELELAGAPESRLPAGLGAGLGESVTLLSSRIGRLETQLRAAGGSSDGNPSEGAQRCVRALLALERCRAELEGCLRAGEEEVVFVSSGERRTLRSAPLDVSGRLNSQVFSEMPVVLTSATMAPGLATRLGAPGTDVTEIDVGSPFDYAHNGLLYCAVHLPDRRSAGAADALHDELEALITAAEGRTLALFTSRRAMEQAAAVLSERVPWPVHVQGDLPKPALVAAFAGEEESCLFATMGYWQGVDVPGASLSLVVLDKLPFPRPDDPLMAARREAAGPQGFRVVDLPRAATLLAQGAGRLIRTATDRGVVAVLDPRLAKASYSGYLVKALPAMRRTRQRDEAVQFLRSLRD